MSDPKNSSSNAGGATGPSGPAVGATAAGATAAGATAAGAAGAGASKGAKAAKPKPVDQARKLFVESLTPARPEKVDEASIEVLSETTRDGVTVRVMSDGASVWKEAV